MPRLLRRRSAPAVATVLLALFVSCADADPEPAEIAYLLPASLPDGWALGLATERSDPVPDYTVSWASADAVGRNRAEAADAPDRGPLLFLNVGARAYLAHLDEDLPRDPGAAPISRDGEVLRLDFERDGIPVSVGGREVGEQQLRRFASGLVELPREEWRRTLGERLLVDDGS